MTPDLNITVDRIMNDVCNQLLYESSRRKPWLRERVTQHIQDYVRSAIEKPYSIKK